MKDETYYFHQTPGSITKELIKEVDIEQSDVLFEPFKGEGGFYNNFPEVNEKVYTEIEEDLDYKTYNGPIDWIITNPPFKIDNKNAFYQLLEYFSEKVNKGVAFLGNDYCLNTLTPIRLRKLNEKGLYIHRIVVCNIKKWRGRYYFIIFKREPSDFYKFVI